MTDTDEDIRLQSAMETSRMGFDTQWRAVADVMLPRQADFIASGSSVADGGMQGEARHDRIFDSTATMALDNGVSVAETDILGKGGMVQQLTAHEPELRKVQRVRAWFERKGDDLLSLRNAPGSGFASQTHESFSSLLAFGNQGMWPDLLRGPDGVARGLCYHSEHIGALWVQRNFAGQIDRVHRKFTLRADQAAAKWRDAPPTCVARAIADRKFDQKFEFLHILSPNRAYAAGRADARGKPVASHHIALADKQCFDEGGYRTMPLIYSAYERSPTEEYGRGPGMNILPDVLACQEMAADLITAINFMARPALGASTDQTDNMIFYAPGSVSFGTIDDRGNPLIRKLWDDPDLGPAIQYIAEVRANIKRVLGFEDLYIARQAIKSHVSATEIMQREADKGVLLAPLKRQEDDWFTPMMARELDLMEQLGLLDDMPPELVEAGASYSIVYDNPLSRSRQLDGVIAYQQLLQIAAPIIAADPNAAKELNRIYPPRTVLIEAGRRMGVPVAFEATPEEIKAADDSEMQRASVADALATGEAAAGIAEQLSGAGLLEGIGA